jgi:uncharacterized membrane protein YdjX (TVP38/TMEM64 family)
MLRFALMTAATVAILVWLATSPAAAWLRDRAAVQAWVTRFGPWAPLAGIVLGVLQVIGLPLPASVLALVNGYLFGPAWGAVIGLIGGTLGMLLTVGLARVFGRPLAVRLLGTRGTQWLDHYAMHPGLYYAALITVLVPGIPDNVIFFAIGLSRRRLLPMLALALVLRLPAMLLLPYIGSILG